jgi:imidazolonepropionase-like amidohydrolase
MKTIQSLVAAVALAGTALSSGLSAEDVAITGGTAFTNGGKGKVENATVLMSAGKIVSVTPGGDVPAGYRTVDASGKWVTTGFMVGGTNLGLGEISLSGDHRDHRADKAKDGLSLDVSYSLNPQNAPIANTRIEGVTRAVTQFSRSKDMWIGTGAVIQLGGSSAAEMIVKNKGFVHLDVDEGAARSASSRSVLWASVIDKLDKAKPKPEKDEATEEDADDKKSDKKDKKKGASDKLLAGLFDGTVVLQVNAHRVADIRQVLMLQKKYGLDVMLVGAAEAWMVADELAASGIPVVLNPLSNLPARFDMLGSTSAAAGRLNAAGVKVAFLPPDTLNARLVVQSAGNAVAMGMPWDAAVDALTVNAAEIFGVADSYGKMTAGMDADVVVWDGDPLEVMTSPDNVFIMGEEIPLVSRQTKLRDRYKEIPRAPGFKK